MIFRGKTSDFFCFGYFRGGLGNIGVFPRGVLATQSYPDIPMATQKSLCYRLKKNICPLAISYNYHYICGLK